MNSKSARKGGQNSLPSNIVLVTSYLNIVQVTFSFAYPFICMLYWALLRK